MKKLADELNSTYNYLYKSKESLQEYIEENSDKYGISAEEHELDPLLSDLRKSLKFSEKLINTLLSNDISAIELKDELSKICMIEALKNNETPIVKLIKISKKI
jgi:hypothetical protein